jgi:hypothetical protein
MTKRPCPWAGDADVVRSLKNHVSQIDTEKRSESAMAAVYSRTLERLFGGAKQNGPNNNDGDKIKLSSCSSCVRTISGALFSQCNSCRGQTCSTCLCQCEKCGVQVCGNCSIEHHGSDSFQRICLGCRDSN